MTDTSTVLPEGSDPAPGSIDDPAANDGRDETITFLEVFSTCTDVSEKLDLLAQALDGLVTGEHAAELKARLDQAKTSVPTPEPAGQVDMTTIGAGDPVQAAPVEDQVAGGPATVDSSVSSTEGPDTAEPVAPDPALSQPWNTKVQGDIDEAQDDLSGGRLDEVASDLDAADKDLAAGA